MLRRILSSTLEAAVRIHFGLTQAELGRYLGVSERQVGNLEAGRRLASAAVNQRLERLAQLLPPPEGTGPTLPASSPLALPNASAKEALAAALPDFGPLAAGPLQARQRQVASQAAALRWGLHRDGKRETLQQRREWGLAVLQAALPGEGVDAVERAHIARWLRVLAADVVAAAPSPDAVAARALAVVRLLALDVEAAALAQLLAGGA